VAKQAGVGRTTVSRVLNNGANVRDEVRDRVRRAVAALGYQVNVQARHLASGSSRQFALIHATNADAEPNSYYHSGLELGAMRACVEKGYTLVTHTANPSRTADDQRIMDLARGGSCDGIILTPPYADNVDLIRAIVDHGCPVVCVSAGSEAKLLAPWVGIDDRAAGEAIGDFLLQLGHRQFAYIDGPEDHVSAGMRLQGFVQALEKAGMGVETTAVVRGNFTFKSGVELSADILGGSARPTALVCANDDMAAGALLTAHKLGMQIPADISIVGFDDTPVSEIIWPPLTTVHQPIRQLGARAVERLVAVIQAGVDGPKQADGHVPFWVVERLSTAEIPSHTPH
jgi:LacI family transcriptional regulator